MRSNRRSRLEVFGALFGSSYSFEIVPVGEPGDRPGDYSELTRSFWSAPFLRRLFRNVKNEPGSALEAPKQPQGYQNGTKMTPKWSSGTCFFGNRRKCDFEQPSYEKAILLRFAAIWKVTKIVKKTMQNTVRQKNDKNSAWNGPGRIFEDFGLQKGTQNVTP